jgi:transcription antitermination factor NusA-like protein
MPQKYASLAEARNAILLASSTWRQQFDKLSKVNDLKVVTNEALDSVAGATVQVLDEVQALKVESTQLRSGVEISHTMAKQAMEESKHAIDRTEAIAEGSKKDCATIGRRCNANTTKVQTIQRELSENVLIVRGIPSGAPAGVKESTANAESAFMEALGQIKCPRIRISSIKRLQKSNRADPNSPKVLRVALASALEKRKLFEAIESCTKARGKVPFSCSHEVPKYAMSSYKYCNKLATLCKVGDPKCKVRVYIPKGESWPVIFIRRENDKDFRKLSKTELEEVKKELANREKKEKEAKQAQRARANAMDTSIGRLNLGK